MMIDGEDRRSRVRTCLDAAGIYGLSRAEARSVVEAQMETIRARWRAVADEAGLSQVDRRLLAGRAVLHPYGFEDLDGVEARLGRLAAEIVADMRI